MKYSICMTNYNTEDVLSKSLDSILSKINTHDYEIVIVDSCSKDRSPEILKRYAKNYSNIKILSKECLRGKGRQIAFENSEGDFIITADCDTIYNDNWIKLINCYEKNDSDFAVSAWFTQIYPRELLENVGGWKNLQYWEDVELWSRLAKLGKYKTCPIVCGQNIKRKVSKNFVEKKYRRFRRVHDKVLLAKHIPLTLYIKSYIKLYETEEKYTIRVAKIFQESTIVLIAKVICSFRRSIGNYGDIEYLNSLDNTLIKFNFSEEDLKISESKYATLEGCIESYKNGDYKYLP